MTKDDPKYVLEATREQMVVIKKALDLFSRIHMGQLCEAQYFGRKRTAQEQEYLRKVLDAAKVIHTGMESNAYFGIHQREIPDEARVAWDIQQVIRHKLAWDSESGDNIKTWKNVDYNEPMRSSPEPLPTIEKKSNA